MTIRDYEAMSLPVLRVRYKRALSRLKKAWPGMTTAELRAEIRGHVCPAGEKDGEPTPAGWTVAAEELVSEIHCEAEADRRFASMAYGDD